MVFTLHEQHYVGFVLSLDGGVEGGTKLQGRE